MKKIAEMYDQFVAMNSKEEETEDYASTLYNNHRMRSKSLLPTWAQASSRVRNEFRREAHQLMGV